MFFSQTFFNIRRGSNSFLSLDLSWKLSGTFRRVIDNLHALYFIKSSLILLRVVIDILRAQNQDFLLLMTVLFVRDDDFLVRVELAFPDIEGTWLLVLVCSLDASVSPVTWILIVHCLYIRPFAEGRRTLRQLAWVFWTEIWVWSLVH